MSYNQLKIKDLEEIYIKVYSNACELIEDAELLYKHERYARSYLAAQIAFEELGKLPILHSAAIRLHNDLNVDWKDLSSKMRNHKSKTSSSFSIVMMFEKAFIKKEEEVKQYNEDDKFIVAKDLELFKEMLNHNLFTLDIIEVFRGFKEGDLIQEYLDRKALAVYMNDFKNHSLYADFKEAEFLKPSEIISEEKCRKRLKTVLFQQKFVELSIPQTGGFRLFKYEDARYYNALKGIIDERMEEFKK